METWEWTCAKTNANFELNLKVSKKNLEPVGFSEELLVRTRSDKVVYPRRYKNFNFARVFIQFDFIPSLINVFVNYCLLFIYSISYSLAFQN